MIALGLSSGAGLIFRGKTWQGILSLSFFCGIAVVVEIVRSTGISGVVVGTFILIGIGVIVLVKAFILREEYFRVNRAGFRQHPESFILPQ